MVDPGRGDPQVQRPSSYQHVLLADLLRHLRAQVRTRWRRLGPGRQSLLVLAHLRKAETCTDLAAGFVVGTTTVYRYLREALDLLAAQAPTLEQAIEVARGRPT